MAKISITPDSSCTIRPGSFVPAPSPIPVNHFAGKDDPSDVQVHTEPPPVPVDPQAAPIPANADGHVVNPAAPPIARLVP